MRIGFRFHFLTREIQDGIRTEYNSKQEVCHLELKYEIKTVL